jgi:hypothetical protein
MHSPHSPNCDYCSASKCPPYIRQQLALAKSSKRSHLKLSLGPCDWYKPHPPLTATILEHVLINHQRRALKVLGKLGMRISIADSKNEFDIVPQ